MKLTMTKLGQALVLASGTSLALSPMVFAASNPAGAQAPPVPAITTALQSDRAGGDPVAVTTPLHPAAPPHALSWHVNRRRTYRPRSRWEHAAARLRHAAADRHPGEPHPDSE